MSYLLYKNRHRAKALLLSFLNFEALLVVEVMSTPSFERAAPFRDNALVAVQLSLELWDIIKVKYHRPLHSTSALSILPAPFARCGHQCPYRAYRAYPNRYCGYQYPRCGYERRFLLLRCSGRDFYLQCLGKPEQALGRRAGGSVSRRLRGRMRGFVVHARPKGQIASGQVPSTAGGFRQCC